LAEWRQFKEADKMSVLTQEVYTTTLKVLRTIEHTV